MERRELITDILGEIESYILAKASLRWHVSGKDAEDWQNASGEDIISSDRVVDYLQHYLGYTYSVICPQGVKNKYQLAELLANALIDAKIPESKGLLRLTAFINDWLKKNVSLENGLVPEKCKYSLLEAIAERHRERSAHLQNFNGDYTVKMFAYKIMYELRKKRLKTEVTQNVCWTQKWGVIDVPVMASRLSKHYHLGKRGRRELAALNTIDEMVQYLLDKGC